MADGIDRLAAVGHLHQRQGDTRMAWLEGFDRRPVTNRWPPRRAQYGRTHLATVDKLLLHTTEGPNAAAAFSAYDSRAGRYSGGVHPHFTVDPYRRLRYQHVPTDRASYSLKGGDRDGVIQIEIVGYSRDTHNWPADWLEWLGSDVFAPIFAAVPTIPRIAVHAFLGASDGLLAAPYPAGKARLSPAQWLRSMGVLGHQHSPPDDHWDPGRLDVHRILRAAVPAPVPDPEPEGLPAMYDVQRDSEVSATWATWSVNGSTYVRWFGTDRPAAVDKPGGAFVIHEQSEAGLIRVVNPSGSPF